MRATSACFVMVYVAATASAVRILHGGARAAALVSCALAIVVALFSGWYLLVPAVSCVLFFALRTKLKPRRQVWKPASDAGFESDTDAVYLQQRTLLSIMSDASADEWLMDSGGCPGWTVHDIRLHLGLTLASFVDRGSLADVRGLPAERAKDDAQKDGGLRNIPVAFLSGPGVGCNHEVA